MPVDRPWQLNAVMRLILGLAASLCVGGLVGTLLGVSPEDQFEPFVISNLTLHGAVLFLVHLLVHEHRLTWVEAFGFRRPGGVFALLLAMGVTAVALPCTWALGQLSGQLMQLVRLEPVAQPAVTTIQNTVEIGRQIYMGGMAVTVVPLAEELLFRGVLYPALKAVAPRWLAIWGSALVFGMVHFTLMSLIPLTVLALLLTWLYEKTGNLLAPIFAHALFNLANLFLMILVSASSA